MASKKEGGVFISFSADGYLGLSEKHKAALSCCRCVLCSRQETEQTCVAGMIVCEVPGTPPWT